MPQFFPPPPGTYKIDFGGIDLLRSRDCVVFTKGETFAVAVSPAMIAGGWPGGQGVQWVNSTTDEFTVTYSSGLFGGYLIWGSNESADQYTAMTGQQLTYGYAVMVAGRGLISTRSYEQYTYASRLAGPPYVPLVYAASDLLFFSLRGLWTIEDELSLSGSPLAPAMPTGVVAQLPKNVNEFFLGIQVTL
jgi:hypothetical protein